jgi:hypothetical protein
MTRDLHPLLVNQKRRRRPRIISLEKTQNISPLHPAQALPVNLAKTVVLITITLDVQTILVNSNDYPRRLTRISLTLRGA